MGMVQTKKSSKKNMQCLLFLFRIHVFLGEKIPEMLTLVIETADSDAEKNLPDLRTVRKNRQEVVDLEIPPKIFGEALYSATSLFSPTNPN